MKLKLAIIITLLLSIIRGVNAQSVTDSPENFNYWYTKACKSINKNIGKAEGYAIKAGFKAKDSNQQYQLNYLLGNIFYYKKEYNKSILYYEESLKHANAQQSMSLKNNLAYTHLKVQNIEKALAYAKEVLKVRKKQKHQYLYLVYGTIAEIYSTKNSIDSAKYYISQAIHVIPDNHKKTELPGLVKLKGDIYAHFNLLDTAIALYEQSISLEPSPYKKAQTVIELTQTHIKKRDYHKAKKLLAQVKAKQTNLKAQVLKLKAEVFFAMGQGDSLKATFAKLSNLLNSKGNDLLDKDKDLYMAIRGEMYSKMANVAQLVENKANARLDIILGFILFVCSALVVAFIAWKQAKKVVWRLEIVTEPTIVRALTLNPQMQSPQKKEDDLNNTLGLLKNSRFWSD